MADYRPIVLLSSGIQKKQIDADSLIVGAGIKTSSGGLTITPASGSITMAANTAYSSTYKATGLASATTDGDAIAYGQSGANLAGLTIDTAALAMSSQKITGLGAASSANDAIAYGQASAQLDGLTMSGSNGIAMNSQKITALANGTASTDAVNYGQLQSLAGGLDPKGSCRVRATGVSDWTGSGSGVGKTLTAPTNASSHNTQGGETLVLNDRVLVDDETADVDNGIYYVTALGNDTDTSFELTRATDADEDAEVTAGMYCFVTEGDDAGTGWFVSTADAITVDTTAIAFSQFAGPGSFTGGNGIDITSGVVSVDLATNPGLEFDGGSPNKLQVKDYNGITVDANGVSVNAGTAGADVVAVTVTASGVGFDIAAIDGDGLAADGAGTLDVDLASNSGLTFSSAQLTIDLDGTTLSLGASGISVLGVPAAGTWEIGGVATSANVSAANLTELTGGGATTLHTHAAGQADEVAIASTADVALTAGQLVCFDDTNAQGYVALADATTGSGVFANPVGFVVSNASQGASCSVRVSGETTVADALWDTAPGAAQIGLPVFMSETAGNVTYQASDISTSGAMVRRVGWISYADASANTTKVVKDVGEGTII